MQSQYATNAALIWIMNEEENRTFLKAAEELSELSVEILHAVNKPNKNNQRKIHQEIEDVEKYLLLVKKILKKDKF